MYIFFLSGQQPQKKIFESGPRESRGTPVSGCSSASGRSQSGARALMARLAAYHKLSETMRKCGMGRDRITEASFFVVCLVPVDLVLLVRSLRYVCHAR